MLDSDSEKGYQPPASVPITANIGGGVHKACNVLVIIINGPMNVSMLVFAAATRGLLDSMPRKWYLMHLTC